MAADASFTLAPASPRRGLTSNPALSRNRCFAALKGNVVLEDVRWVSRILLIPVGVDAHS
jgi:hypothetical protein